MMDAHETARRLAARIDQLVAALLPNGHREGAEWRCGSIGGGAGDSLGVHLTGPKAGVWADFSTEQRGDALDLVCAVLALPLCEAIAWSRQWFGVEEGRTILSRAGGSKLVAPRRERDFWREPWLGAAPIAGTLAERYLTGRGLSFLDPHGSVLRFAGHHARRRADRQLEHHPALLALLRDAYDGHPVGTINVYLRHDGSDRLRDPKGKTSWGRAACAAAMLSGFGQPTYGLTICEGVETGIGLLMAGLAPLWSCGGAGNLRACRFYPALNASRSPAMPMSPAGERLSLLQSDGAPQDAKPSLWRP
jgi:hypothetical protein